LNGIARFARDIQNLIAVSAPRAGNFSLLVQREVTKRKHARMARIPRCASRRHRRSPQLAGRWETRLGLEHEAREYPDAGCDARARHTGREQNLPKVWFSGSRIADGAPVILAKKDNNCSRDYIFPK
jgi:hypothetical protein